MGPHPLSGLPGLVLLTLLVVIAVLLWRMLRILLRREAAEARRNENGERSDS